MPIYSITDSATKETVLVNADNSAQAIRLYMGDRLVVTAALDAAQAVTLLSSGIRLITAPKDQDDSADLPFSETNEAAAFTDGFQDCDKQRDDQAGPSPSPAPSGHGAAADGAADAAMAAQGI